MRQTRSSAVDSVFILHGKLESTGRRSGDADGPVCGVYAVATAVAHRQQYSVRADRQAGRIAGQSAGRVREYAGGDKAKYRNDIVPGDQLWIPDRNCGR